MFYGTLGRIVALAIAAATITACTADAPLAPRSEATARISKLAPITSVPQMYRDEATVPFSFVVYASCANAGQGEVLQASGELQYKGRWATSNDGQRHHHVVISRFTGSATGWESGEAYDVITRDLSQGNIAEGTDGIQDSGEELDRVQLRLTSRVTGAVIDIILTGRFVETAGGEFVLDGWDAKTGCR